MSTDTRNRDPKGVSTGGQFAAEAHSEDANVKLAATQPSMDTLAVSGLKALAVNKAKDKRHFGLNYPSPFSQRSEASYDADVDMAGEIDSLDPDTRKVLMQRLKISRHVHLLEPGQKLGNASVAVSPDAGYTDEEFGRILATQGDIDLLELDEPAKVAEFFYGTPRYEFSRKGVTQNVIMHDNGNLSFSTKLGDDHDSVMWANTAHTGGVSSHEDEPNNGRFAQAANFHLKCSLMADEASKNERLAPLHKTFTDFDPDRRTLRVKADGEEVTLDLSGDQLSIKDSQRKPLPQMMAAGFMKQYAKSIKYRGGAGALEKDLRKVFDNAEARMAG